MTAIVAIRRHVDQLTRDRDRALEQLALARARVKRERRRRWEAERSRALWKARAQARHGSFGRSSGRPTRLDEKLREAA